MMYSALFPMTTGYPWTDPRLRIWQPATQGGMLHRRGTEASIGVAGVLATRFPPESPWLEGCPHGHGGAAREEAKRSLHQWGGGTTNRIDPAQIWVDKEQGPMTMCTPTHLSSPPSPPHLSPKNGQRLTLPCWKGEGGGGEGAEWGNHLDSSG